MHLNIAIPTYNRLENLCETLRRLTEKTAGSMSVTITILNNGSPLLDYRQFAETISRCSHFSIRIIDNPVHIGGVGNIQKCFELFQSDWLYVLGDSKLPVSNYLEIIESKISQATDASFIYFSPYECLETNKTDMRTVGVEQFLETMDSFGHACTLGDGLYNMQLLKHYIHIGATFAMTYAGQLAIVLVALAADGVAIKSRERLIEKSLTKPAHGHWDPHAVNLGFALLSQLPISYSAKKLVQKKIKDPSFESTRFHGLLLARLTDVARLGFNKRQAVQELIFLQRARTSFLSREISTFIMCQFIRCLFLVPSLSVYLVYCTTIGWRKSLRESFRKLACLLDRRA